MRYVPRPVAIVLGTAFMRGVFDDEISQVIDPTIRDRVKAAF